MKKTIVKETTLKKIIALCLRYKVLLIGLVVIFIGTYFVIQKIRAPKEVMIITPISRGTSIGQVDLQSMQIAFDESGGKAGVHKVTFLPIDTTALDDVGNLDDLNRLDGFARAVTDERAVVAIGPISTDAMMRALPIVNIAGIAHINFSASYSGFVVPNYTSRIEYSGYFPTGNRNFFSLTPHTEMLTDALARGLQRKRIREVYLISGDNSFGRVTGTSLNRNLLRQQIAVVASTTLTTETVESTLSEIEASAPDCIVVAHFPNKIFRAFLDGLIEKNLTSCVAGPFLTLFYASMYGERLPKIHTFTYVPGPTEYDNKSTKEQAFLDAYEARYGALKTIGSAYRSYSAMKLALQAIAESNGTKEGVLEALHNLKSFEAVFGRVTFNDYGLAEPLIVKELEIVDGKVLDE